MPTRAMTALSAVIVAAISAGNACAEQVVTAPLPPPSMPAGSVAVERTPLGVPGLASNAPAAVAIASLNDHLDAVQELLTDQEDVRPGMVEQGENLQWGQIDEAITDGDFADVNSAEKQIGWSPRSKNSNQPKLRRPRIDIKAMTRLKLNESGSTVLDITKGRVVTKF